ncbi:MAG: DUF6152 family protein [Pseudomonadota bacterium]|nr:hypothetical protein [Gammaproteobacteria bacterium]MEE2683963.1 DUF6152 family protein [Pseudomonadota bacterium]|tara:strand:+ start:1679 stop:2710 length:1032 start_codon:yes stop_codon:yes gene_type:complete
MIRFLLVVLFFPFSTNTFSHHSVAGIFDSDIQLIIEGTVTDVVWRNPHVHFTIATSKNNEIIAWDVEITSLSTLRRRKIESNFIEIGDKISVAGNPSRSGSNEIYVRNILLPSGSEIILENSSSAVFDNQHIIGLSQLERAGDGSSPDKGIFRVWSTAINAGTGLWLSKYPLTENARKAREEFDPVKDGITANCRAKGMPTIMEQPYPMEFVQQTNGNILINLEEYNTTRVIHMTSDTKKSSEEKNRLGISYGKWEGSSLVVKTTNINWPHFDRDGIPLSEEVEIEEYFTLSEDGSRLDYRMHLTDPINFTSPIVLGSEEGKHWLWYPEIKVEPFNCIVDSDT